MTNEARRVLIEAVIQHRLRGTTMPAGEAKAQRLEPLVAEDVDAILAALKAAGYSIEKDWDDIENARKDGTEYLTATRAKNNPKLVIVNLIHWDELVEGHSTWLTRSRLPAHPAKFKPITPLKESNDVG